MQAGNNKEPILPIAFNDKINWKVFWQILLLPLAATLILLVLITLYSYLVDKSSWYYFGNDFAVLMMFFGFYFRGCSRLGFKFHTKYAKF